MIKYKIVKFVDGNGEEYFQIWTHTPSIINDIFDIWEKQTYRYTNLKQAQYAVREMKIEQTVVEEGEIDV